MIFYRPTQQGMYISDMYKEYIYIRYRLFFLNERNNNVKIINNTCIQINKQINEEISTYKKTNK